MKLSLFLRRYRAYRSLGQSQHKALRSSHKWQVRLSDFIFPVVLVIVVLSVLCVNSEWLEEELK